MGEKHVAVCDNCRIEADLQNPDKLNRWPNRPPENWFVAGPVGTVFSADWSPQCFCCLSCLGAWANA